MFRKVVNHFLVPPVLVNQYPFTPLPTPVWSVMIKFIMLNKKMSENIINIKGVKTEKLQF